MLLDCLEKIKLTTIMVTWSNSILLLNYPECIPSGTLFVDMGMLKLRDSGDVATYSPVMYLSSLCLIGLLQYSFSLRSCFHDSFPLTIMKITLGIGLQFLCSYITFPLYALVTQVSGFDPNRLIPILSAQFLHLL